MAKVKCTSVLAVKNKITDWKNGIGQADEIIYDPAGTGGIDGADLQIWGFNTQGVLVEVGDSVGTFKKITYFATLV
jgi:hypothetical protein